MAATFVDLKGLTLQPNPELYALALGLEETVGRQYLRTNAERLELLAQLREGAGVTIHTGPAGAAFWSLASAECQVVIEPEGEEWKTRLAGPLQWALVWCGCTPSAAATLIKKPPTPRSRHYLAYQRAILWMKSLDDRQRTPLVVQEFAVEIILPNDADTLLAQLDETVCAMDWEWRIDDQAPVGLAISTAESNYYLPVRAADFDSPPDYGYWLRQRFGRRLAESRAATILHGGRADMGTQVPFDPVSLSGRPIDDTMVMAYLLGEPALGLKDLTKKYLGRRPIEFPLKKCDAIRCKKGYVTDDDGEADVCDTCRGAGKVGVEVLSVNRAARYAAGGDTRNTYDLFVLFTQELALKDQLKVYLDIERPLVPVIASMEKYGAPMDMAEVIRLRDKLREEEDIYADAAALNYGYNVRDNLETRAMIKRYSGYDPGTTDKRVISGIKGEHVDLRLGWKSRYTVRNNFLDKHIERWEKAGCPTDYRVYGRFNQAGSAADNGRGFKSAPRTGRLSSSAPNLQNQSRKIRSIFTAPEGCVFWSYDYSGLELRIAAALSGDPEMLRTILEVCPDGECHHYPKHGDLHDKFKFRIFEETGTDVERPAAKQGNFEQQYLGGPDKLMQILAVQRVFIEYEIARLIVETHHVVFAGYHSFAQAMIQFCRDNGYAQTITGRRRYIPEIHYQDAGLRGSAERASVNMPVQGTAADVLKIIMVKALPVLTKYGAHLSMQVHDEICGSVPEENAAAFDAEMKQVMQMEINGLPLFVEGGYGRTWADAH